MVVFNGSLNVDGINAFVYHSNMDALRDSLHVREGFSAFYIIRWFSDLFTRGRH
jgi:hypothetical protein